MNITLCSNYSEMSRLACTAVLKIINGNKKLLFCAATGHSPSGLYRGLAEKAKKSPGYFKQLRIIKLDEWEGVPDNHPVTCEHFIRTKLLAPLGVAEENYISFVSDTADAGLECNRIRSVLEAQGPIDLCILGLGTNGHLGLNEPGKELEVNCHRAQLSEKTLQHGMIRSIDPKPSYGMTLGMKEILSSKKIVLLITGENKKPVFQKLMAKKISSDLPASLLWLHNDVECFIDQTSIT